MLGKIKELIYKHTKFGKTRYLKFLYRYDMQKYIANSGMNEMSVENLATQMRILCHAIEKGLSLPECKQGFGKEKIQKLIELYNSYSITETKEDSQVLLVVRSTILEYINFHEMNNVDVSFIPQVFRKPLSEPVESGVIHVEGKKHTNFHEIARSRHSLRYYANARVSKEDIYEAVTLAQTAPSACNRQSTRVFACLDEDKIQEIIKRHGGIKGFGKPSVIFAITGDLILYQNEYERNTIFVDGGIFLMNFLYALDSCGIAACPVIWGGEPSNDEWLSALLRIPKTHKIISLITAGYFPEGKVKVAVSPKRETHSILRFIED